MAVNIRQIFPIQHAKERRIELARYLRLDGGRHLLAAVLLLAFMSLLSLGQTGQLAAQGHTLTSMQQQKVQLLQDRNSMLFRLSQAQSLDSVERRAVNLKLRPLTADQVHYLTLEPTTREEHPQP
jgi:hypothetical protein